MTKGKLHGCIDVGLSVMSIKKKANCIDLDTEEHIYHLKVFDSMSLAESTLTTFSLWWHCLTVPFLPGEVTGVFRRMGSKVASPQALPPEWNCEVSSWHDKSFLLHLICDWLLTKFFKLSLFQKGNTLSKTCWIRLEMCKVNLSGFNSQCYKSHIFVL